MERNDEWVESRMAVLCGREVHIDTARAWGRFQSRRSARSPRVWRAVGLTTAALCLMALVVPSSRAIAQRLWNSIFFERVAVVSVDFDRVKSLTAEFVNKPDPPRIVKDAHEAARAVGFTPSLPTTLSGSPRLSVLGPIHARLVLRRAAIEADLQRVGVAGVVVPAEWDGLTLFATFPASVTAEYHEITLMQSRHVSVDVPSGVSLQRLGEIVFRVLGSEAGQARELAGEFARNPSWFLGIDAEDEARLEKVSLVSGSGMLIEDAERIGLVWSTPERLYALSGRMTRELAIATANSVR